MPQSLSKILVHITFSTKSREPYLTETVRDELHSYIAGICKGQNSPAIAIGGHVDHVHILCVLSRNVSVSKLVEKVKTGSSKWIKTKGAGFRRFSWQNGYAAFSVSQSQESEVGRYIAGQSEHHRRTTFQDELRRFLEKYRVAYDERYIWG